MLYACPLCNRSYKKDKFPLKDEANRVIAPGSLDDEEPLVINPAFEDPAAHIRFNRHIMIGITDKGKETVDMFQLNDRPVLVHDREQLFENYSEQKKILESAQKMLESPALTDDLRNSIHEIIAFSSAAINQYKSPDTPYSGMFVKQ